MFYVLKRTKKKGGGFFDFRAFLTPEKDRSCCPKAKRKRSGIKPPDGINHTLANVASNIVLEKLDRV